MGLHRVGHNWSDLAAAAAAAARATIFPYGLVVKNLPAMLEMQKTWVQSLGQEDPWRRAWQPMPVFLPGESHRLRSLAGYSPLGCKSRTRLKQLSTHTRAAVFTLWLCVYEGLMLSSSSFQLNVLLWLLEKRSSNFSYYFTLHQTTYKITLRFIL